MTQKLHLMLQSKMKMTNSLFNKKELLAKATKLDQLELDADEDQNSSIQEERVMISNEDMGEMDD